jgi:hypothetical protein
MFITVLAIICLNLAVPGTCMTEPVVNSNQEQLTMGGCLALVSEIFGAQCKGISFSVGLQSGVGPKHAGLSIHDVPF